MYKVIYTAFKVDRESGKGTVFTSTNMRSLSANTGLGYDNLVRIFTRNRKDYWKSPEGWEVLKAVTHFVGDRKGIKSVLFKTK